MALNMRTVSVFSGIAILVGIFAFGVGRFALQAIAQPAAHQNTKDLK